MDFLRHIRHYRANDEKIYADDQWDHDPTKKNYLHLFHLRRKAFERKVLPVYSSSGFDIHPLWVRCKTYIHDLYIDSPLQEIVEHAKKNCAPNPFHSYQLRPVTFGLDLDHRGSIKQFSDLYDEIFTALTNLRREPRRRKTESLYYVATTDIIILNEKSLRASNVTISEHFNVFVASSCDSVIIVSESVALISNVVQKAFRTIYAKTDLKYVPLMLLLVNPIAEAHDFNWQDRMASSECILLREQLLQFGAMYLPHKVFFVRSTHVLEDVEHALHWLWRKSGVRDRHKAVPRSTSTTKKRWTSGKPTVLPQSRLDGLAAKGDQFKSTRKQSILAPKTAPILRERSNRRKVRIDPIPVDMERKVTVAQSLTTLDPAVDLAKKRKSTAVKCSRSLSATTLKDVKYSHPELKTEFMEYQGQYPKGKSVNSTGKEQDLGKNRIAFAHTSKSISEKYILEEKERMLRAKFAEEETKYLELKCYQRKLQEENRVILHNLELLLSKLHEAKSNVLEKLLPPPTFDEHGE